MIEIVLLVLLLGTFTPLNIFYSLLGFSKDTKNWKRYFLTALLFVFVVSYNYHPAGNSDLVRYVEWIKIGKKLSLLSYIDFMGDGLYVSNFLFWLAGQLEMPYLVPAFTTTVVYAVTIYITCDFAEKNNLQSVIPYVLIVQVLLLPYVTIINNVRNVFAFSLVIYAAYRDIYLKKRNIQTYLLYFLPVFVHKTSFVLIAIRLLSIVVGKYMLLSLVVAFLIPTILTVSVPYISTIASFGTIGKIVGQALLTGYNAMNSTTAWAITVMTGKYYLLNRYFSYFMSGLFLLIGSSNFKKINFKDNIYAKRYIYFFSLICVITIATNVFRTPVYWRFFAAVVIATGPILLLLLKEMRVFKLKTSQIWLILLGFGLFFLALQFYGTTHEIDYKDWLLSIIFNPMLNIFRELIFSIIRL
ncbi:TPA: EpsG family protein [Streptococcus suis]